MSLDTGVCASYSRLLKHSVLYTKYVHAVHACISCAGSGLRERICVASVSIRAVVQEYARIQVSLMQVPRLEEDLRGPWQFPLQSS